MTVTAAGAATVVATPDLSRRTWYRLRYDGDAHHLAPTSATVQLAPQVYLTRPSAPRRSGDDVRFTSTGTLKPRHTAGAKTIRIKCYKKVSGAWKLKQTVYARNVNKSGGHAVPGDVRAAVGRQVEAGRLPPNDALHAATTSAARYVTVR